MSDPGKTYDPRREALAERAVEAAELLLKWVAANPGPVPDGIEVSSLVSVRDRAQAVVGEENAKLSGQAQD